MARNIEELEIRTTTTGTVEVEKLDKSVKQLGDDSQRTGNKIDVLGKKSKTITEDLKKMNEEVKKSTKENNKSANSLVAMGKKALGVAAVVGVMRKATNEYIEFDNEVRKVGATLGANAEQMKLVRRQAQDLGIATTWSAADAAKAQFEFAKAGFSVNEILAATPSVLNTAKVGQLGLAEATEITAGTLRMFKLDAEDSTRVGDVLAKTATSATTDIRGLGEALKYAGLESSSMGLSLEETSAILGSLAQVGLKGSTAGTGLRRVFASLKEEAKQQKLMNIGVQLTEDGDFRNFLDILDDVKAKTKDMAKAQKKSFLSDVFGVQGEQVINVLLDTDEKEFDKLLSNLKASEGYSKRVAELMENGLGGAFLSLKSAIAGVGIAFIDNLEPAFIGITKAITGVTRAFGSFLSDLYEGKTYAVALTAVVGGLAVGYGAYLTTIKAIAFAEKVKTAYMVASSLAQQGMTIAMALYTGQMTLAQIATWGLNAALAVLTAPVALIVGAVAALGAGFYILYKKSETFRKAISPLVDGLKTLWGWVKKFTVVGDVIKGVKKLVGIKDKKEGTDEVSAAIKGNTETSKTVNATATAVTGENTDYLLGSGGTSSKGGSSYTHNGYYLKGSKGGGTTNNSNIYSSVATTSQAPEKSYEEKILEALISIKQLLISKKEDSSKVNITVNKSDNEEILEQVTKDLTLALSNM